MNMSYFASTAFLECILSGIFWGNAYLLRGGACVCKHITYASHSGTKMIRGNETQAGRHCFIEIDSYQYVKWRMDELEKLIRDLF